MRLPFPPIVSLCDKVGLTEPERQDAVDLCEAWINDCFMPAYGVYLTVGAFAPGDDGIEGSYKLGMWPRETVAGAAGHHEADTLKMIPWGVIDMSLHDWPKTMLHELGELAHDPYCDGVKLIGRHLYADEIADAIENDTHPADSRYTNLVLPSYFTPEAEGPYDLLGTLNSSIQPGKSPPLSSGGYMSFLDLDNWEGGWQQVFARFTKASKLVTPAHSRRARRQTAHVATYGITLP